jgi:hypothetical protein
MKSESEAKTRKSRIDKKLTKFGGIVSSVELAENLAQHCIPNDIYDMDNNRYDDFLVERRRLIAQKIKKYYPSLYSTR